MVGPVEDSLRQRNGNLRRFYRLECSQNSPGNGLDLRLVAAVANLHGARIEMADNFPGLIIELCFPIPGRSVSGLPDQEGGHWTALLADRRKPNSVARHAPIFRDRSRL